jgi:hypothetical protein
MSFRFDVARYHKALSVLIFGGGLLAVLVACVWSLVAGRTGLGVILGVVFLLLAVPMSFYFLDLFVWQPRRQTVAETDRMREFITADGHRRDREHQRAKGMRG